MPFAFVNGQKLFYEDTGGPEPALVFSHGMVMDCSVFAPQVAALQGRFRCIVWDQRGHGQTADPQQCAPFDYYDSVADLVGLLDHLGVENAVLVGNSQGGFLGLRCALVQPQRVRALVLMGTQAMHADPEKTPDHHALFKAWAEHGLSDDMAVALEHYVLGQGFAGAAAWRAKWKRITPPNLRQSAAALLLRDDISARLPEIPMPTLVIHGEHDQPVAVDRASAMAQGLPHAQWVQIPQASHTLNLTHADSVNAALELFLAQLMK